MSFHIHSFRNVFWLFGVLVAGLIVAGMLGDFSDPEVSEFSTPPGVLESDVHAYQSERSIASETVLLESVSTGTFGVGDTVQTEGILHQSEAVVVAKKDTEDPLPMKTTGSQVKVPATTESVKVDAVVSENDIATTSFNSPKSLTTDGLNRFVVDANNHKIRAMEIATGQAITLTGSGEAGLVDNQSAEANFNSPRGIPIMGNDLSVTIDQDGTSDIAKVTQTIGNNFVSVSQISDGFNNSVTVNQDGNNSDVFVLQSTSTDSSVTVTQYEAYSDHNSAAVTQDLVANSIVSVTQDDFNNMAIVNQSMGSSLRAVVSQSDQSKLATTASITQFGGHFNRASIAQH
jgi:hypothetical protein